jgi:hypothetical protein
MTGNTDQIIMTLFGTGKLEEVPIDEIKDLVKSYPSFNIGHYLLSKRLDKEKNEESIAANFITALYFNNPFWLQWLLQHSNNESLAEKESDDIFSFESRGSYTPANLDSILPKEEELFIPPKAAERETEVIIVETFATEPAEEFNPHAIISEPDFHQDESPDIKDISDTNEVINTQMSPVADTEDDSDQEQAPVFYQSTDTPIMENEPTPLEPAGPTSTETFVWINDANQGTGLAFDENEELARISEENERLEKEWQEASFQLRMLEQRAAALRQTEFPALLEEHPEVSAGETILSETQAVQAPISHDSPTIESLADQPIPTIEENNDAPISEAPGPSHETLQEIDYSMDDGSVEEREDYYPDSGSSTAPASENAVISGSGTAELPDSGFWANSSPERHLDDQVEEIQNPISILHEESASLPTSSLSALGPMADAVPPLEENDQVLPDTHESAIEENVATEARQFPGDVQGLEEQKPAVFLPSEAIEHEPGSFRQENSASAAPPDTPLPIAMDIPEQSAVVPGFKDEPRLVAVASTLDEKESTLDQVKEAPKLPAAEAPLFDPFHTIDYFASQGIKYTYQDNPNDKFGKQLKSFTDWLKIMKRLPQKQVQAEIEQSMDSSSIESFAAHSLDEKDTLTETMATVLIKQGKYEKAIEIYQKLSLLNTAKSAYFAAKIEELKTY